MKRHVFVLIFLCVGFTLFSQAFTEIHSRSAIQDGTAVFGDYDNDGDQDILYSGFDGSSPITRVLETRGYLLFTIRQVGLLDVTNSAAAWGDYDSDGDLDILLTGKYLYDGSEYAVSRIYRNDGGNVFTDIDAGLEGVWSGSVAWGDYDNDGDLDILLTGNNENGSAVSLVYRNDGDGDFVEAGAGLTGVSHSSVAWLDMDNDGDLDILLTGRSGIYPLSELYRNDGNDVFVNIAAPIQAVYDGSVACGDYDDDGRTDFILTGNNGSEAVARIYHNDGEGYFSDVGGGIHGVFASSVAWCDFDFDGMLDLVVQGDDGSAAYTTVYRNEGNHLFTDISAGLAPMHRGAVSCADINGDKKVDILSCGMDGDSPGLRIYSNAAFQEVITTLPDLYSGSGSWGDYDNDGDLDLLLTGYTGSARIADIYRNNGGDSFVPVNAGLASAYGVAKWGDYDNDGDLDILMRAYSNVARIYRNDGSDVFTIVAGFTPLRNGDADWGDYDNDGDLDIIIAGSTTSVAGDAITKIYRNDGGDVFTEQSGISLIAGRNAKVEWGDYDADGDLDILICGEGVSGWFSTVYRNDGGDGFKDINAGLQGIRYSSVAWGDYDNDGDLDILLSGSPLSPPYKSFIYRNDGHDQFTDIDAGLFTARVGSAGWADYDSDGDLDVLITSSAGSGYPTILYRNNGNDRFTDIHADLQEATYGASAWGDYDLDGDLDLLIMGRGYPTNIVETKLLKNVFGMANQAPTTPTDLKAIPSGENCTLTWERSFDNETARDGLSYNIRIGRTPDDVLVKSPMSDLTTGSRKVTPISNIIQSTSWTISKLETGTYYWSVQAVDKAFAGSSFAALESFTIDFSNSISPTDEQTIYADQDGSAITVTESLPADSRRWEFSVSSGGPYDNIPGATGTTYIPSGADFGGGGTYYLVCTSLRDGQQVYSNEVRIIVNQFEVIDAGLPGLYGGSLAWGDLDQDNDLDLILLGRNFSSVYYSKIYRNDGGGVLTEVSVDIPDLAGSISLGDYDNDNDLDLLLSGYSSSGGQTWIYRNEGGFSFTNINAGLPGLRSGSALWGDADNDGDLDILLSGKDNDHDDLVTSFRNDGDEYFTESDFESKLAFMYSMVDWDFDNDGDLDRLNTGYNLFQVMSNYGEDVFVETFRSFSDMKTVNKAVGDYDGDGDLDIIVSGTNMSNQETSRIVLNRSAGNAPPSPPSGLNATLQDGSVLLSWNEGTDTDTPGWEPSYNLYIYQEPSGEMSVSPMSDISSGYRFLPTPVKLVKGSSCELDLNAFSAGTSYWSVQSVDNNYAASAFPAAQAITDIPPTSDFSLMDSINVVDTISVVYYGNASASATYHWNFEGADYVSGSGPGPYRVHWPVDGAHTVSLSVEENSKTSDVTVRNIWVSGHRITEIGDSFPDVYASSVSWGDYDNDHDMDIFMIGYTSYQYGSEYIANVYRNDGNNAFTEIETGLQGVFFGEVAWGDYDNDGDLDVLVSGDTGPGSASYIGRNDGLGVFTDINAGMVGMAYASVAWGDYDNDGDLDALIGGQDTENWEYLTLLYRNNGNDAFEELDPGLPGIFYGSLDWGDYDNDGYLDILISGETPGWEVSTMIYRNNGDGSFSEQTDIELPGIYQGESAWGDYDSDGDLDILITGYSNSGRITTVFRNDGANQFTELEGLSMIGLTDALGSWGDIDSDGDLDILVSGEDDSRYEVMKLYRNEGNDQFTELKTDIQGVSFGSVALGDYDYDNDLDIMVGGIGVDGYYAGLYRNDLVHVNARPSPPNGLAADVQNDRVILSWNSSTDEETPQKGLSYNVFLWSESGGLSAYPMADSIQGDRMISTYGNAGLKTEFMLDPSGLGVGKNYWTVQSIDNSYTASELPEKQIFYINPTSDFAADQLVNNMNDTVKVSYTGNASSSGSYTWDFDGASYMSGTGQGPYLLHWDSPGSYTLSLQVEENGYSSDVTTLSVDVLSQSFSEVQVDFIDHTDGDAAWGDYDNDGDLDLLITGSGTKVYRNDGNEIFTDLNVELSGASKVDWVDYDNDGDLDILSGSFIYRNDGNDLFTPVEDIVAGDLWGDHDGDGDIDFCEIGTSIVLHNNEGNGVFTKHIIDDVYIRYSHSAWGDSDNDGDLDILVTGYLSGDETTRIYRNDGNFEFSELTGAGLVNVQRGEASWGDYDNDGDLDIFIYGEDEGWVVRAIIYENHGSNDFGGGTEIHLPAYYAGGADWGDFDNDGDLDLCITYQDILDSCYTKIFRNEGNFIFNEFNADLKGLSFTSVTWGDFDNDSDQDLLVSGEYRADNRWREKSILYRNEGTDLNTPPSSPTGLSWSFADRKVNLSWDRSTDAETPQSSLSYNLFLGPKDTLFSYGPMADTTSGHRLIPARGNMQSRTAASIDFNQLFAGENFWSVQALDQGYAGSAFAEALSFTLPPTSDFQIDEMIDLCDTATVMYSGNATSSADYEWDFDGGEILSGNGPGPLKIRWNESGTHTVILYVVANGSYSDTTSQFIEVNSLCISEFETEISGLNQSSVQWGDYDNDSDLDILIAGMDSTGNVKKIFRNEGDTVFTDTEQSFAPGHNSKVDWGDYDNDGNLDLFLADNSLLYKNAGNGSFNMISLGLTDLSYACSDWGDYDNDGDLDLVIAGLLPAGEITRIYRNEGNSVFTVVDAGIVGLKSCDLAWGDYDNDGDLDLLVSGRGHVAAVSRIYRNEGRGVFTDIQAGLQALSYSSVDWGDLDSDGDLDVLLTGESDSKVMYSLLYRNDGGDVFTMMDTGLQGVGHGSASFGDFDNDGESDVILAGMNNEYEPVFGIYTNDGDGAFTLETSRIPGVENCSFDLGDFDHDDDLDIIISGDDGTSRITRIFRNRINKTNTAPSVPDGLSSIVQDKHLVLSWNESADGETADRSLSYNVYVKSKTTGNFVVGPNAVTATGFPSVPEPGNAGLNASYSIDISNWPTGAYYWSVQAIDNSMTGSDFADADTVLNIPPTSDFVVEHISTCNSSVITYTGNASGAAVYDWVFEGADNISGTGQGPYEVSWNDPGDYTISLQVTENGLSSGTAERTIHVMDQCFTDIGAVLQGTTNGSVSWGDYDGDGDLDLVLTGQYTSNYYSRIYRNDGLNIFSDIHAELEAVYLSSTDWGDYDNDGDLDVIITGQSLTGDIASIYRNDGKGVFTDIGAGLPGIRSGASDWGDFDHDGDLDLLLTGTSAGEGISKIYRNDGSGKFTDINALLEGVQNSSVAWCDYNTDGDLDFVLTGKDRREENISLIYRNDGRNKEGKFIFTDINAGLGGFSSGSSEWGDFDHDGDPDLLLAGEYEDIVTKKGSRLYRNNGNDLFIPVTAGIGDASFATCGDFDNDGSLDILLSGYDSDNERVCEIYHNNGDGEFVRIKTQLQQLAGSARWGDMDNDGDLDILVSGSYIGTFGKTSIYRNEGSAKNSSPSMPGGMRAHGTAERIVLSWNPSDDLETPGSGLSYNVRVGTTPGGNEIVSGMADPYTGFRQIVASGNVGHDTSIVLFDVPASVIYWSVQAVDNAYAGSLYTEELASLSNPTFSAINSEIPDVSAGEADWGDFDNDNDLDLVISGISEPYGIIISDVYRNDGDTAFTAIDAGLIPVSHSSSAWGDYDNDNDLDLLLTGKNDELGCISLIYRNDGGNSFVDIQAGLIGIQGGSTAWGDHDNDGDLDLLLSGTGELGNRILRIYENMGNDQFSRLPVSFGVRSGSVDWGDFDNDGDLDILFTGTEENSEKVTVIYRNNRHGHFTELTGLGLTGLEDGTVDWGDYDNDGDLDILLAGSNGTIEISKLYRNDGNDIFTDLQAGLNGIVNGAARWGDYDNDGDLDILLTGSGSPTSLIYRNDRNDEFTLIDQSLPPNGAGEWGDFDRDGDLDIVMVGTTGPGAEIFRNNGIWKYIPPVYIVNLQSEQEGYGIRLSWEKADNEQNTYDGVSYNIRIGSELYASDMITPMSEVQFGDRRIPAMGNMGLNNTYVIDSLAPGRYYWSVQAIAQSFKGWNFSSVDSFEISVIRANFTADTVCLGDPTQFTDQSLSGGSEIISWEWDFNDGSTSTDQDPVHTYRDPGPYFVTLKASSAEFTHSRSKEVYVKDVPRAQFIADPVCIGTPTVFENVSDHVGLTIDSWNWDLGDGNISDIQVPESHSYSSGTYDVRLIAVAGNSCSDTIIKQVRVAEYPASNISVGGNQEFCEGDSLKLSVPQNDAYTYQWNVGGTDITDATSNEFYAYFTGDYMVAINNTVAECSSTSGTSVEVTATRPPDMPVIYYENYEPDGCREEAPIILSVYQEEGLNYQWKRNGSPISLENNSSYSGFLIEGEYTVELERNGCYVESDSITIQYADMLAKPEINVRGPVVWYLGCSNDSAAYYKWYYGDRLIEGAGDYLYVAGQKLGKYSVGISNDGECFTMSDPTWIPPGTGLGDLLFGSLQIYPNPTTGKVFIDLENYITGELIIEIYEASGVLLKDIKYDKDRTHFQELIDLNNEAPGVYFMQLKLAGYNITRKVIVK